MAVQQIDPNGGGDWFDQQGLTDSDPTHPSWLTQPGAKFDPSTGSITLASGQVLSVPPNATRDPATGNISFNGTGPATAPKVAGNSTVNPADYGIGPTKGTTADQSPAGVQTQYGMLSGADKAQIDQMLSAAQSTDDPQYWYNLAAQHGGVASTGVDWLTGRINQGDGALAVRNGTTQKFQDSSPLGQMAAPAAAQPTYTLPTLADVQATPGYQFQQQQGEDAINHSAVAKGLSGGTLKDLATFNQGLADSSYQNAVGNSLNAFGANQGANQQGFNQGLATNQFNLGAQGQFFGQGLAQNQNAFNQYNTNQNTAFNQWLSLANLGNPGNPFTT